MRLLLPIILLAGLLHAQDYWVRWNGELTTPDQREFAQKCYEFGKQYGRGHSLMALAWMESSLGRDSDHEEESFGPFGISKNTRQCYGEIRKPYKGRCLFITGTNVYNGDFKREATLALQIFEDNCEYFRRLGYSPGAAYYWAAARYNGGNTPNERYARLFNRRVRALKEIFK